MWKSSICALLFAVVCVYATAGGSTVEYQLRLVGDGTGPDILNWVTVKTWMVCFDALMLWSNQHFFSPIWKYLETHHALANASIHVHGIIS